MSIEDIDLNLNAVNIETTAGSTPAVSASHAGIGNITIDVFPGSRLTTTGLVSHGISGVHTGSSGSVNVTVSGSTVETGVEGTDAGPHGIFVKRGVNHAMLPLASQAGDLSVLLSSSSVTALGNGRHTLFAQHFAQGTLDVLLSNSTLATTGTSAHAVLGQHLGQCPESSGSSCTARIRSINGTRIMAPGSRSNGITLARVQHPGFTYLPMDGIIEVSGNTITAGNWAVFNSTEGVRPGDARTRITDTTITTTGATDYAVFSSRADTGDQTINLVCTGSPAAPCKVTTKGTQGYGILGWHSGNGDTRINVQGDYVITTESVDLTSTNITAAHGIYGLHQGTGDIHVSAEGIITTAGVSSHGVRGAHTGTGNIYLTTGGSSRITTAGPSSYGVYGLHTRSGNINLATQGGSGVTTKGSNGHGIVAYQLGTAPSGRSIDIMVRGPVTTSGTGAQGVRVGTITDGAPARVAARGANGFLQQTVTVNDAITSAAEGIYLAGGGRVVIGPSGAIRPDSGIAILATGDIGTPVIKPRLRVDLHPSGQRMTGEDGWLAQALGGGWILNDGGETTIAVNNVVLHEGASGVVANAVAPNGAWNVTMRAEGVNVSDYSSGDPMTWTKTEPATGIVLGRDFSADDFTEVRRLTPPPDPEPEPAPEPDPSPSDPDPDSSEPSGPMIIEDYAPRAALYEALPEFLLGLRTQTDSAAHRLSAALPLWLEVSGHSGEHDPQDSTVGTGYDTGHRVMTLGGTLVHNEHWNVQASVHRVSGSAEVSSAVKGGDIEAEGRGISLQARWSPGGGPYASGRIAWTDYALDLDSDDAAVGRLVSSVGAERLALQLEAGHRLPWGTRSFLTPQVGVSHTQVDIDRFTDATGARAAFRDTERSSARLGVRADTTTTGVALYGAVHLAHHLETGTTADVSGERLRARTPDHDLHLALGAQWQTGPWILQAGLGARHALGSDSHAYSGDLRVGVPF